MRVTLDAVHKGRDGLALPTISLAFETGAARIVPAETEQRPTVLGLIASGRMKPDSGAVRIDGRADAAALRRRVALVDAPDVCDPAPDVAVFGLVAEELMFAGLPSHPVAVTRWLDDAGMRELSRIPIADVSPRERFRLLLELTALRRSVEAMVLVSPQRHGGHPDEWWSLVEEFAGRGYGMLVISGVASTAALAGRAERADLAPEEPEHVREPADEPDEDVSALIGPEPTPEAESPSETEPEAAPEPEPDSPSETEPEPEPEPEPDPAPDPPADVDADEPETENRREQR